jgi:antitoxin (DNA-binding transcriptional repressor) of toxin-antitoxin stability system
MVAMTMDVQEAQARLSELVSLAETGTEIILMEDNVPRARLVPLESPKPRVAGLHEGTIWTSDDFDDPLPQQFQL